MSNVKKHIDHLLHSTVRIHCKNNDGTASTGTGFIFGFPEGKNAIWPFLITNRHVFDNAETVRITLTRLLRHGEPDIGNHETIEIQNISKCWHGHPDESIDLAILPLSQMLNTDKGKKYFFTALGPDYIANNELLNELSSLEDIIMIGYPNSLWDETNNLPIIRKGITATHPKRKYNGRSEFLIDAACFPGSSGSPVFLANIGSYVDNDGEIRIGSRVSLLGVLWGGPVATTEGKIINSEIPSQENTKVTTSTMLNLGFVIHASEILGFKDIVDDMSKNYHEKASETIEIDKNDPTRIKRNALCDCGSGKKFKHCCGALK